MAEKSIVKCFEECGQGRTKRRYMQIIYIINLFFFSVCSTKKISIEQLQAVFYLLEVGMMIND